MARTEITLKDLKKENLIRLFLSLQSERDKLIDMLGQCINNLTSTVGSLSIRMAQVESSLVVTKTVNNELLKRVTSLERVLYSQEQYSRRECLEVVGIPSSVNDKNLQSTVCSILGDINLVCDSNDIEDCNRIKGDRTIIKFSSRRKSSKVLSEKKKLKNLSSDKCCFLAHFIPANLFKR